MVANTFVTGGFGNSLIQKKQSDDLDFSTVFYFSIGFSFLLGALLYFTAPIIAGFYDMEILTPVLRVMIIQLPFAGINSVQQAYISKKMLFRKSFLSTIVGTLISAVFGLVMAYQGYGIWALVYQYIINTIINTIVLFFIAGWKPKIMYSWSRMKELFSFGWKILVTSLLFSVYSQIQQLLIGKKYTSSDLAYCNKGAQFPNIISNNLNSTISKVFFPALSEQQHDYERLKHMTRRAVQIGTFVLSPVLIGLLVIAKPIVIILLTDKWLPSVPYLQIYCIIYLLQPIQTANIQAMNAIGRSDIYMKLEIIKKIIGIAFLGIALFCFNNVIIIIYAALLSELVATLINAPANKKLFKYSYKEQLFDILPSLAISSLMAAAVYFIQYLNLHIFLIIILQVFVGSLVYIGFAKIFKMKSLSYIYSIMSDIIKRKH